MGNNGCLQRKDLTSGLERLGVRSEGLSQERWTRQVENLFRWMAQDDREVIFLEDFRAALEFSEALSVASPVASPASGQANASPKILAPNSASPTTGAFVWPSDAANTSPLRSGAVGPAVPPSTSQALSPASLGLENFLSPMAAEICPNILTGKMCQKLSAGRFKVKWHKHSSFRPLWSDGLLTLWAASELIPRGNFIGLKRGSNAVKERIAWAHYVSTAKPSTHLVEVTDEQHSGFFAKHPRDELNRFLGTFFPHPIRFRQIWRSKDTSNALYIWVPVPPSSDYVAVGMLCTTVDEAPDLEELRCMPRLWAEPRSGPLFKAWSGTGVDRSVASMWLSGDTGVLQVSTTEEPPETYEMSPMPDKKFYISLPLSPQHTE